MTADQLGRLEPVRGLSPARLQELAALCRPQRFALGTDPLQGVDLDKESLYLLRGELKLDLSGGGMQLLVGGCDAANWPIGRKSARPAGSKAITEVEILRLDDNLLDIMMTWDQLSAEGNRPSQKAEDASLWKTITGAVNAQMLTGSGLSLLPPAHLHELMLRFDRIRVKRGQVLIREGEIGDYYYLIESGRARVTRQVGGAEIEVADLRSGEAFGEEALVSDALRSASVAMASDGVLLRLGKADFVELLKAPLLHAVGWAEAAARVAAGAARWLDVRYAAEFTQNGLDGAMNIPLNELRAAFDLLDGERDYIVYCQSGRRSSAAAFLLAQHGFRACWLEGGLAARDGKQ